MGDLYKIKEYNNGYIIVRTSSSDGNIRSVFEINNSALVIPNKQDAEHFCWAMNYAWQNHGWDMD